jgi:hypothetical protein
MALKGFLCVLAALDQISIGGTPQSFRARVLTPNQGAHLVPPCEQEFGEIAADAAHSAGCSGHEDWVVVFMFRCHIADLRLRAKDGIGDHHEAGPGALYAQWPVRAGAGEV